MQCTAVSAVAADSQVLYEERDVFMSAQFSEEFQQRCPNQRVPQVFCNGKHIGVRWPLVSKYLFSLLLLAD